MTNSGDFLLPALIATAVACALGVKLSLRSEASTRPRIGAPGVHEGLAWGGHEGLKAESQSLRWCRDILNGLLNLQHAPERPSRKTVVGIIPARFESTRFPGKPLIPIAGKLMIQRTWEQAAQATSLDALYIATDHPEIFNACQMFGAQVVMTSKGCPNGTERCKEAHGKLDNRFDIVVNIQGDEPLIEPEVIDAVANSLKMAPDAVYSTACTPLAVADVHLQQRVKCVTDVNGYALYFSRSPIPGNKDGHPRAFPPPFADHQYLLHLGLQCYDSLFLDIYPTLPATPLMCMEDLEQLKVLEHGYKIKVITVDHCAFGVDTPDDVPAIEKRMKEMQLV